MLGAEQFAVDAGCSPTPSTRRAANLPPRCVTASATWVVQSQCYMYVHFSSDSSLIAMDVSGFLASVFESPPAPDASPSMPPSPSPSPASVSTLCATYSGISAGTNIAIDDSTLHAHGVVAQLILDRCLRRPEPECVRVRACVRHVCACVHERL